MDEAALFRMIKQMRQVSETAAKTTKRVRREAERRKHAGGTQRGDRASAALAPPDPPPDADPVGFPVHRFEQIEEW